MGQQKKRN